MYLDCDLKWRGIFCKDSVEQLELKSSITSSRGICQFDSKIQFKIHCEKLEASISDDTHSCTLVLPMRMILQALKY